MHFLCKKWGPKGFSIHPLCIAQKEGSLQEACSETKTRAHTDVALCKGKWTRGAPGGVEGYYVHCAVGQLKLFGCFFWSYIYQTGAGGLALQAAVLLCPHWAPTHVCTEVACRYQDLNALKCFPKQSNILSRYPQEVKHLSYSIWWGSSQFPHGKQQLLTVSSMLIMLGYFCKDLNLY